MYSVKKEKAVVNLFINRSQVVSTVHMPPAHCALACS